MRKIHEETTTQVLERKCGQRARTSKIRSRNLTIRTLASTHLITRCSFNYFFLPVAIHMSHHICKTKPMNTVKMLK